MSDSLDAKFGILGKVLKAKMDVNAHCKGVDTALCQYLNIPYQRVPFCVTDADRFVKE